VCQTGAVAPGSVVGRGMDSESICGPHVPAHQAVTGNLTAALARHLGPMHSEGSAADMRDDYLGKGGRSETPMRSVLLSVMPTPPWASEAIHHKDTSQHLD
jgi:hypothetical protein